MEQNEECPYCGKKENVIGIQDSYANIRPNKLFSLKEQAIYHVVCLNCGSIIRSYVKNPKELITK